MKHALKSAAVAGAALLCLAAAPKSVGWSSSVSTTTDGYLLLGNPKAAVRLTEYVSYTCTGCARFQVQSDGVLLLAYGGYLGAALKPRLEPLFLWHSNQAYRDNYAELIRAEGEK